MAQRGIAPQAEREEPEPAYYPGLLRRAIDAYSKAHGVALDPLPIPKQPPEVDPNELLAMYYNICARLLKARMEIPIIPAPSVGPDSSGASAPMWHFISFGAIVGGLVALVEARMSGWPLPTFWLAVAFVAIFALGEACSLYLERKSEPGDKHGRVRAATLIVGILLGIAAVFTAHPAGSTSVTALRDVPAIPNWPPKIGFDKISRTVNPRFNLDNTTSGTIEVVNISRARFGPVSDDPQVQTQENGALKKAVTDAILAPAGQPPPFSIPAGHSEPYIIHSPRASAAQWTRYLYGQEALYFYGDIGVTMSDGTKTGYPICGFIVRIVVTNTVC